MFWAENEENYILNMLQQNEALQFKLEVQSHIVIITDNLLSSRAINSHWAAFDSVCNWQWCIDGV